ncbi:MAG: 50S ribosomal protein L22 [Candidatus Woesearchaeota archaeon]
MATPTKEGKNENISRAIGRDLGISTKQSIEICKFISKKKVDEARSMLQKVIEKKMAVPYTRFNGDIGHKRKIGPGRYPQKASKAILKMLNDIDANAQFKGLNTSQLVITQIKADRGASQWRFGRKRRIKAKSTMITIIAEEKGDKNKDKTEKKVKVEKIIEENDHKEAQTQEITKKVKHEKILKESVKQNIEDKK